MGDLANLAHFGWLKETDQLILICI